MPECGVDIVIVTHDSAEVIGSCLRAVERFFGTDANVLVFDNASGDATVSIIREQLPRANLVEAPANLGFAAAVNRVLGATTGGVVALVNPDVSGFEGSSERLLGVLFAQSDVAAVAPRLVDEEGRLLRTCRRRARARDLALAALDKSGRYQMLDWDYSDERQVDVASGAVLLIRRAALEDVGFFDETFFVYAEEEDWLIRAQDRGWRTIYTPYVAAAHRAGHGADTEERVRAGLLLESQLLYARKHFGPVRTGLLRAFFAAHNSARLLHALLRGAEGRPTRDEALARLKVVVGSSARRLVRG